MIPMADLRAQHAALQDEVERAVTRVLRSGRYALGPEVEAFEREFAAYCGAADAVGVSSGTSALHLALRAYDIGPGDEVITVPLTFVATVATIRNTGARVRLVDIDPRSYTMDPSKLEAAIGERTRAIVPVHLYGQPADMDPILAIGRKHGLAVIEDAAQAHGASYHGRPTGGLGDLGCFSFYPSKNLGACGEGGMILTNDAERARLLRVLRDWGQDGRYRHVRDGGNYRLDAIQAAVLRVKLRRLDGWNARRRQIAAVYDAAFADLDLTCPEGMAYATHVYHIYALRSGHRDALRKCLTARDIQVDVHYPIPMHLQPTYVDLGYDTGAFPHAEAVAREELSLPIYPELSERQIEDVIDGVRAGVG